MMNNDFISTNFNNGKAQNLLDMASFRALLFSCNMLKNTSIKWYM